MLAAALTLALLTRAAQRRGGRPFALRAAALLYIAPLFAVLSAYVIFDMPLTLCVTAVWLGLAAELDGGRERSAPALDVRGRDRGRAPQGPGDARLGAGRQPRRGAPLPLARAAALARVVARLARRPRRRGRLVRARQRAASPSTRATPSSRSRFERLTSGSFKREQPWWFVPVVLAAGALPWSLATPWWRRRTPGEESLLSVESRVGLGFVLFAAVFFSLSHSKLVTYLLPALPMLAWTAAEAWSDAERARRAAWGLTAVFLALALAFGLAGFGPWLARAGAPFDSAGTAAKIIAACFAYVALRSAAAALGRPDRAFIGILLFTPVVLLRRGRAAAALRRLAVGRAAGARHHRHRARRLRALRGLLQSRHRFPAGAALGAGERARPRDDQQLPGPLPRHAASPAASGRRSPRPRTPTAWTSSCVPRVAARRPRPGTWSSSATAASRVREAVSGVDARRER